MEQVAVWTIVFGTAIFSIGLISARASRKQRKQKPVSRNFVIEPKGNLVEREDDGTGGLSMAAGGTGNVHVREDDLAAIGGNTR
jgi:hypothetical protein